MDYTLKDLAQDIHDEGEWSWRTITEEELIHACDTVGIDRDPKGLRAALKLIQGPN